MGPIEERLLLLLEPAIVGLGYELLGVDYIGQGKHSRLRVYIDSPNGVGLADCEAVSHQVSGVLDVEDPIKAHYALEVSSPGLDRPLFKTEHYARYIGKKVKLRTRLPLAGQRNFHGEIQSVENDDIYISIESGEQIRLTVKDIERANLIPEF